jgi:molecular chaperone DnaK (HSP70)
VRTLLECKKATEALSTETDHQFRINGWTRVLDRAQLNDILTPEYEKVRVALNRRFEDNQVTADQVKEVHCCSGLARNPQFTAIMKSYFPTSTQFTNGRSDAVVVGAAMSGAK